MQKVVLALFALAVVAVNGRYLSRERRQLGGLPIIGSLLTPPATGGSGSGAGGATGTGSGGVAGVGAGVTGTSQQQCQAMQATCASAACSSSNTQINEASGSGLLLGLGQGVGNVGAPINVCPPICATCTQLSAGTIGKK